MITSGVALLALAVLAAIGRSRVRSFGLLLGAALFLADVLVELAAQMIAPVSSVVGMDRAASVTASGIGLTAGPRPAFWVGALGIAILVAMAVLRLVLAPRRPAFPEIRPRPNRAG